jgi:hypothetical protein
MFVIVIVIFVIIFILICSLQNIFIKSNVDICKAAQSPWETKWSVFWFDLWWVIDLSWFEFKSGDFGGSTLWFVSCGKSCLLVLWCVGDRCGKVGSDVDRGKSRRLSTDDRRWSSTGRVLDGRMIEKSDDVVCGLYRAQENEEHRFLGWAPKPKLTGFLVWASKPAAAVWWFGPQNHHDNFLVWALKLSGLQFIGCATKPTGGWRQCGTRVEI